MIKEFGIRQINTVRKAKKYKSISAVEYLRGNERSFDDEIKIFLMTLK